MPLARPLGDFDAPGSQLPLRFISTPERTFIVLAVLYRSNSDSIHNPVEPEDKKKKSIVSMPLYLLIRLVLDHF